MNLELLLILFLLRNNYQANSGLARLLGKYRVAGSLAG